MENIMENDKSDKQNNNKSEKSDNKPPIVKAKTFTEEEHKKLLTEYIDAARKSIFCWEVDNKISHYPMSLAPEVHIKLSGGDAVGVRNLGIQIEQLILDYAKSLAEIRYPSQTSA
jgi:hypothetical protein